MKPIHLPNFVIALIRTPRLPPNFAQFAVPLELNKLDLKNYLRAAYKINCIAVRSHIKPSPVVTERNGRGFKYVRKKPEKRMTIEMDAPFIWPGEPEDLTKFDDKMYKNIERYRDEIREEVKDNKRGRLEPKKARSKLKAAVDKLNGLSPEEKEEATQMPKELPASPSLISGFNKSDAPEANVPKMIKE